MLTVADQAIEYIRQGWRVTPVRPRQKRPEFEDWPRMVITEAEAPQYFSEETNIGVILGDTSGGLVDIDLDCPESCELARSLLPPTVEFGRPGNRRSHWLYRAPRACTEKFQDLAGKMLLELRANKSDSDQGGLQTIFPRSIHPSGEAIEWEADAGAEQIVEISVDELHTVVSRLAAATILVRSAAWSQARALEFARAPKSELLAAIEQRLYERIARWLSLPARQEPRLHVALVAPDNRLKRASAYLARISGGASGEGGHQQTWNAALAVVRGFDLSEPEAFDLLWREYNPRCDPPWSERELKHKVTDAARSSSERGYLLRAPAPGASASVAPPTIPAKLPDLAAEAALEEWSVPLPPSITTGLIDLDKAIEGFHAEGTYVLVGPTGRGKTGLALQMSRAVSVHRTVLYFSSELSRRQVLARAASPLLRRPWGKLYRLPPLEASDIPAALDGLKLRVVEIAKNTSFFDVISRVADADGQAPFVVLDYLQHAARRLVPDDLRLANAALMDQITEWARVSHSMALVLSATGRGFHVGNENRSATDFVVAGKESGDVEYNAAGVFFLDCDPCPPGGTSSARLHVAKSRFAGTGATIGLRFDGAFGEFTCDPSSALSEIQAQVLDAISGGCESVEEVRKKLGCKKADVTAAVKQLAGSGVISRMPLEVIARMPPEVISRMPPEVTAR